MYWKAEQFQKTIDDTNFALSEAGEQQPNQFDTGPKADFGGGIGGALKGIGQHLLGKYKQGQIDQKAAQQTLPTLKQLRDRLMQYAPKKKNGELDYNQFPSPAQKQQLQQHYDSFMKYWNDFTQTYGQQPSEVIDQSTKQPAWPELQGFFQNVSDISRFLDPEQAAERRWKNKQEAGYRLDRAGRMRRGGGDGGVPPADSSKFTEEQNKVIRSIYAAAGSGFDGGGAKSEKEVMNMIMGIISRNPELANQIKQEIKNDMSWPMGHKERQTQQAQPQQPAQQAAPQQKPQQNDQPVFMRNK